MGRWRTSTFSPCDLCWGTIENSVLESLLVTVKGGSCQVYSSQSDVCICWSTGLTQVKDMPESTMTVGSIPLKVAAWTLLSVSALASSLLTSSCAT